MTIKAAAYQRTNPVADGRYRASRNQSAAAIAYAREKGFHLIKTFADLATGHGIDRPGLKAMLAAMSAGEFDVVIVDSLDRLSRDPREFRDLTDRILVAGGEVHIIQESGTANYDIPSERTWR